MKNQTLSIAIVFPVVALVRMGGVGLERTGYSIL
jgi:hypothetical protein